MDDILIAILIIQTVTIILTAFILVWNLTKLIRILEKLGPIAEDMRSRTKDTLEKIQGAAENYTMVGANLVTASSNIKELSSFAKETAYEFNGVFKDATSRAHTQIEHADRLCTDVLENGKEAIELISRTLVPPLIELSVVLKSIGVAFRYFLRNEKEI
ncbi:MAG: hypothetical protein M0P57_03425 [Syntrophales bacterium]|jgi:biopolymer transport protein ExbB/TolQ|nr:hypothetical protein [Syntrophales bacterium]MDY0044250.1 hypothetical protein [Syntrophales bacterium]